MNDPETKKVHKFITIYGLQSNTKQNYNEILFCTLRLAICLKFNHIKDWWRYRALRTLRHYWWNNSKRKSQGTACRIISFILHTSAKKRSLWTPKLLWASRLRKTWDISYREGRMIQSSEPRPWWIIPREKNWVHFQEQVPCAPAGFQNWTSDYMCQAAHPSSCRSVHCSYPILVSP